ncbi:MAG: hypothetical protein LC802_00375 [Acidobacteria bacterium]|nr:hypothetical protein [Acidobacteriota bacterium]
MSEEEESVRARDVQPRPEPVVKSTPLARRVGIYAVVLLAGLLLGFVPTWLKARESADKLAKTEQQLGLARLQNTISSAVIDARRGDYEPSRQAASQFFTELRAEADRGESSSFTAAQRNGVEPLFAQRDEIITLLARSDPASADRLSDLYAAYRKVFSG